MNRSQLPLNASMFELIERFSYLGLLFILIAEESGIPLPIPGDIFIATVAALPKSNYPLTILIVVTATLVGSTILFTISKKYGNKLLIKYGKYIKVTPQKVKRIEKWFEKYGGLAIIIGRLIPGLRIVTPIAAGLFDIPYKTFWIYTTIAAFIWANIYFVIGKYASEIISKIS